MLNRLIVLDTNVLVSAAIKEESNPAFILTQILGRKINILVCPNILEEYHAVLKRPKFKKFNFPPPWFEEMLAHGIYLEQDPRPWPFQGPDQTDLVFLSLASQHNACLVTGNMADYPEKMRANTKVITPAQYVAWLGEGN